MLPAFLPAAGIQVVEPASLSVLDTLIRLPTAQEKHPSGTVLRILKTPVLFNASLSR